MFDINPGDIAQFHTDIFKVHDLLTIGNHSCIGNGKRFRPETQLLDLDLVDYVPRARCNRTPAFENALDIGNWFVTGISLIRYPSDPLQEDPQCVSAAFIHERSGHDHIIDKMAGQKPVVRINVGLGLYQAGFVFPPTRIQDQDAVNEVHPVAGQPKCFGQVNALKLIAKTGG